MNMSPFGPLPHEIFGKAGLPKFGPFAFGVSGHLSPPEQSGVSPQI
jgi:hypothetical protein